MSLNATETSITDTSAEFDATGFSEKRSRLTLVEENKGESFSKMIDDSSKGRKELQNPVAAAQEATRAASAESLPHKRAAVENRDDVSTCKRRADAAPIARDAVPRKKLRDGAESGVEGSLQMNYASTLDDRVDASNCCVHQDYFAQINNAIQVCLNRIVRRSSSATLAPASHPARYRITSAAHHGLCPALALLISSRQMDTHYLRFMRRSVILSRQCLPRKSFTGARVGIVL